MEQEYKTALLDSAIKYELLKHRVVSLEKSYRFMQNESADIKTQQRILLDSAIKYELIKPRLLSLEKSYAFLKKENNSLEKQASSLSFQNQTQKQNFELQLADRRKKLKRWVFVGFVGGLLIGAIIH